MALAGCLDAPTLGPGVYCDQRSPCQSDPHFPRCDVDAHQCVAIDGGIGARCSSDGDCTGDADHPVCDAALGACTGCRGSGDDRLCQDRDPATPRCDPESGRCAACRAATQGNDCPSPDRPVCGGGLCRACRAHRECPSLVCLDGRCPPVTFVDNRNGGCSGAHNGTIDSPYCEVSEAMARLPAGNAIHVAASTMPYHRITLDGAPASLTIVGDGRDLAEGARSTIGDPGGPCITPAANRRLRIEDMELAGCTVGIGGASGGVFDVRRCLVRAMRSGAGIEIRSSEGPHFLDGLIVRDNASGGGIALRAAQDFVVQNSSVSGNQGPFGGLSIDALSNGTFAFNTVRNNSGAAAAGGIDCGLLERHLSIHASIVVGNSQLAGGQLGAGCTADGVVGGAGATGSGWIAVDPVWQTTDAADYRLDAASDGNARIIDALPSGPSLDHDIDGHPRPLGKGWDLGAYEAR